MTERMPVFVLLATLACSLNTSLPLPHSPDPSTRDLVVGVLIEPPFVEKTAAGEYSGFAIDLWEEIARRTETRFSYKEFSAVPPLLDAVSSGEIGLAVTDLTVTRARLQKMEFCQPYFHAGLTIMINEDRKTSLLRLLRGLRDSGNLEIAGIGVAIVIVLTLVATLVLRRVDPGFSKHWHDGLAESFYHVVSVAMTGKSSYKGSVGPIGKIVAAIWIVCGVAIVAYITSAVAAEMTANKLRDEIAGPNDLPGKSVGVVTGTASCDYVNAQGWQSQGFPSLTAAVEALVARKIQAIVFDAPALLYFDHAHPELPIAEVGPVFDPLKYAFALPPGSANRVPFNVALLQLEEAGIAEKLRARYFGAD